MFQLFYCKLRLVNIKRYLAVVIITLALATIAPIASAQLSAYHDRALSPQTVLGIPQPVMAPIAYGQVRVCTGNVSNSPCTPVASIFDINGVALSVAGGNFGQVFTDVTGQFTFQCNPGTYTVQVAASASNTPQLNYLISCPSVTGVNILPLNNAFLGNNTHSGTETFTGLLQAKNFHSVRIIDASNSPGWAGTDACAWIASAQADLPSTGG